MASVFYRRPDSVSGAERRLLILIPAHNEELVIGKGLAAIEADRRPQDTVLVVADRCTDATAEIARVASAPPSSSAARTRRRAAPPRARRGSSTPPRSSGTRC